METQHTIIYRHQAQQNIGIQTVRYGRNTIGYVEQGTKMIHQVDQFVTVRAGEIFHLNSGTYYVEDAPEPDGRSFRQTLFFYSPADLRNRFTPSENVANVIRMCRNCANTYEVYYYPAWPLIEDFFRTVHRYVESQVHLSNPELGHLKLCELVHLILSHPSCCVSRPISIALGDTKNTIQEVMRNNIFTEATLTELAALCGMSLSMFKNEFRLNFHSSPHKWLTEKRLTHARLQLITTNRSVADIAHECRFNNSSHFIKLFKERFHTTPYAYRKNYKG